jgi:hypothetical protein
VRNAPEVTHVYPIRDLAAHVVDGGACWCQPVTKREVGGFIIVHNALDDRLNDEAIPRLRS